MLLTAPILSRSIVLRGSNGWATRCYRVMSLTKFTCALLALSLGTFSVRAEQTALQTSSADISHTQPAPPGLHSELAHRLSLNTAASRPQHAEFEALKTLYAKRHYESVWVTGTGYTAAADLIRAEIGRADEWGLEATAFRLKPLGESLNLDDAGRADAEIELSLAILQYARFARGGRTEPLALSRNLDRRPPLLDPGKVIAEVVVSKSPDAYLRSLHPQHPQFERLRRLFVTLKAEPSSNASAKDRAGKKRTNSHVGPTREKLLANMEQWRWMPEDLGRFYVWVNIPEYSVRVIKDGHEIHSERVIVGGSTTRTPIFSDEMEQIIFHPRWNVPNSIKVNELLPSLAIGDYTVLSRQNLRVALGGRDIDPKSVNWNRADIKKYYFYQPPGDRNALGVVKFLFPNKHDVYLHDTPSKGLFNSQVRAFSHGCIRVRHPLKLAELLLSEDQGWDKERVARTVQQGPQDTQINLAKILVHLTYFTAWVDDDGRARTFPDVYDHEHRIALGLAGKTHLIRREPEPAPTVVARQSPSSLWSQRRPPESHGRPGNGADRKPDWIKQLFQ